MDPVAASASGSGSLPKVYDPRDAEPRIHALWEEQRAFVPSGTSRVTFSVVMPPPNVTGILHIGHAMDDQIPDVLVRHHRMKGERVVWVPGMDHAGIATQAKMVERLQAEGKKRQDLSREQFVARTRELAAEHRDVIGSQLRRLGVSADWNHEAYTLDDQRAAAVREVFVRLYERGLIYRDRLMTQWCPGCGTTLSDTEVEHEEEDAALYRVAYEAADGDGEITVATVRPETIPGDVAIAVHPEDPRYAEWIGRRVRHPLTGALLPVVADEAVDPEFGTGAVKITPAHDPVDFEVGRRRHLPEIRVIGDDGRLTVEAGRAYQGMSREDARRAVIHDLAEAGLLRGEDPYRHAVGRCYRCGSAVEPRPSPQWFCRMAPLAARALDFLDRGELEIVPARFEKVLRTWLEGLRDWCVSRQLWWGHPIPAWHGACGHVIVARNTPASCPICKETRLTPDPDVLDTWFSSALWPFTVFGWPSRTEDLAQYYPTSVLSCGYDILFLWVSRMLMEGLEFLGQVPFRKVLLHGLVRDAQGRKMSKSLGNGVDPVAVIGDYGSDALRFSLTWGITPGNDLRFRPDRVEAGRNLANKIWNAGRFAAPYLAATLDERSQAASEPTLADRWILSRLYGAAAQVERHLDALEVGEALRVAHDAFWGDLCDSYLEWVKARLTGSSAPDQARAQITLREAVSVVLRLLHPFMPYVTEALWQELPGFDGLVARAAWPEGPEDAEAEAAVAPVLEAIHRVRNLRREFHVQAGAKLGVVVRASGSSRAGFLALAHAAARLMGADVSITDPTAPPPSRALTERVSGAELSVVLGEDIDLMAESTRLDKERQALVQEQARLARRLADPGFRAKAPQAVREQDEERSADLQERLARLDERADRLAALLEGEPH